MCCSCRPDGRVRKGRNYVQTPWRLEDYGEGFKFKDVVTALTLYKKFYGSLQNITDLDFMIPSSNDAPDRFGNVGLHRTPLDPQLMDWSKGLTKWSETDEIIAAKEKEDAPEAPKPPLPTPIMATEWPPELAGMRLGRTIERIRDGSLEVKHIPERKKKLDRLGFDWGDPRYSLDIPFEKTLCGLYVYYQIRGDTYVPFDFPMPSDEPWPEALAGFNLGEAAYHLRVKENFLRAYHPEKFAILQDLHFQWFHDITEPLEEEDTNFTPENLMLYALGHPDYTLMHGVPRGLNKMVRQRGPVCKSDKPRDWWRKWHKWDYVAKTWYKAGRRDHAYVLRREGYPKMAKEHEEKYGPGLFTQIETTFLELMNATDSLSEEEKGQYLERLEHYRAELEGCNDLPSAEWDVLMERIDTHILNLLTDEDSRKAEIREKILRDYDSRKAKQDYEDEEISDDINKEDDLYKVEDFETGKDSYDEEIYDDEDKDISGEEDFEDLLNADADEGGLESYR